MTKAIAPLRSGVKSLEMWLMVASSILVAVFPELPKESFLAIGAWVLTRSTQKTFGIDMEKRSWLTSEFWLTIGVTIASLVFPDLPVESVLAVAGYSGVRTMVKVKQK